MLQNLNRFQTQIQTIFRGEDMEKFNDFQSFLILRDVPTFNLILM